MGFSRVFEWKMNEESEYKRRGLVVRWTLLFAAVGWGISLWFVMVPWNLATAGLQEMGAAEIVYDPFLDYWMRVIGLIFGMIGAACLWVGLNLNNHILLIPMLAWFHVIIGAGSAILAMGKGLGHESHPTILAEIVFSLTIGVTLLVSGRVTCWNIRYAS